MSNAVKNSQSTYNQGFTYTTPTKEPSHSNSTDCFIVRLAKSIFKWLFSSSDKNPTFPAERTVVPQTPQEDPTVKTKSDSAKKGSLQGPWSQLTKGFNERGLKINDGVEKSKKLAGEADEYADLLAALAEKKRKKAEESKSFLKMPFKNGRKKKKESNDSQPVIKEKKATPKEKSPPKPKTSFLEGHQKLLDAAHKRGQNLSNAAETSEKLVDGADQYETSATALLEKEKAKEKKLKKMFFWL